MDRACPDRRHRVGRHPQAYGDGVDPTGLPRHILAAGVLVWDAGDRLLLVKTWNRDHLILPGGLVEDGESPASAAVREVAEEVGLVVELRSLVVVEHLPGDGTRPSSVQLVFDSTPLTATPNLVLQGDEIEAAHWLAPEVALERHGARGRARLAAALGARRRGDTAYVDSNRLL